MAVYNCECGLIISTSSDRPQCLRCLHVLGPQNLSGSGKDAESETLAHVAVTSLAVMQLRSQLRQVTMGYRLNERPVLSPLIRPQ